MANQIWIFHIHISKMTSKSQYEKNLDAFAPYYYDDENHIDSLTNPCTPLKAVKTKIPKPNTPERRMEEKEGEKEVDMRQIQQMFSTMMTKLEKLDGIEADMKEIKHSLEYAHAEIADLKQENETNKVNQEQARERIGKLEQDNATLRNKIVDLKRDPCATIYCSLIYLNATKKIPPKSFMNYSKRKWKYATHGIKSRLTGPTELEEKEKEIANHVRSWSSSIIIKTENMSG